jgi:UDP:flavonoid glycosyltransferase YjiC (YdhE family)
MESLAAGVPMVVLPLHIDQPLAAELGAAVVACAVRTVMRGEDGKAVRRRATELREVVARNDADDAQIGALLQRMARLCGKGQQGSQQVAVPNFLN